MVIKENDIVLIIYIKKKITLPNNYVINKIKTITSVRTHYSSESSCQTLRRELSKTIIVILSVIADVKRILV